MNNNFYGGGSTIPNLGTGPRTYYPSPVTTSPTNNIIWVQGIEGAKAYQLSPNSMAILLDSEDEGKMYIKVSDNIGMCTLRQFKYVEEVPAPATKVTINNDLDLSEYVRKDELSNLIVITATYLSISNDLIDVLYDGMQNLSSSFFSNIEMTKSKVALRQNFNLST